MGLQYYQLRTLETDMRTIIIVAFLYYTQIPWTELAKHTDTLSLTVPERRYELSPSCGRCFDLQYLFIIWLQARKSLDGLI